MTRKSRSLGHFVCLKGMQRTINVNSKIFANSLKDIFVRLKNSQLRYDLLISVNNSVISQGFYFHETSHMQIFGNIKPSRNYFPIYSTLQDLTVTVITAAGKHFDAQV